MKEKRHRKNKNSGKYDGTKTSGSGYDPEVFCSAVSAFSVMGIKGFAAGIIN